MGHDMKNQVFFHLLACKSVLQLSDFECTSSWLPSQKHINTFKIKSWTLKMFLTKHYTVCEHKNLHLMSLITLVWDCMFICHVSEWVTSQPVTKLLSADEAVKNYFHSSVSINKLIIPSHCCFWGYLIYYHQIRVYRGPKLNLVASRCFSSGARCTVNYWSTTIQT